MAGDDRCSPTALEEKMEEAPVERRPYPLQFPPSTQQLPESQSSLPLQSDSSRPSKESPESSPPTKQISQLTLSQSQAYELSPPPKMLSPHPPPESPLLSPQNSRNSSQESGEAKSLSHNRPNSSSLQNSAEWPSSGAPSLPVQGPPPRLSRHPTVDESSLRKALKKDKGQDAHMMSWEVVDFAKKGDNYLSIITSVQVVFTRFGRDSKEEETVSYIVKLLKRKENGDCNDFDVMVFEKEGKFYTEVIPLLDKELRSVGLDKLSVPQCLNSEWEAGETQLFLEDLRPRGFHLCDRRKGLDDKHTILVLRELGKLHGASLLLQKKYSPEEFDEKFRFLSWEYYNYSEETKKAFDVLIFQSLLTYAELSKEFGKEDMSRWFTELAPRGVALLMEQTGPSPPYDVIGHGDSWINNLMFRYNKDGEPTEVVLLDLQLCRRSSFAVDLNYLLFTSVSPQSRDKKHKLDFFLASYFSSFKHVLEAGHAALPFTLEEAKEEFKQKNSFGLMFSALLLPNMVSEPSQVQEFDATEEDKATQYVIRKRRAVLRLLSNNSLIKERLTHLYEDLCRYAGIGPACRQTI